MCGADNVPVCCSDLSEESAKFVAVVSDELDSNRYPEEALLVANKTVTGLLEEMKKE